MTSKQSRLILFAALLLLSAGAVSARGREGYLVKPVSIDNGDIIESNAVTVGTTTPVQIFYSTTTQSKNYREFLFQNSSTNSYRVYLGTVSTVSATTGGRWFIPGGSSWTTNARSNLWAIFEAAAFGSGTLQVLIETERDSTDANITDR